MDTQRDLDRYLSDLRERGIAYLRPFTRCEMIQVNDHLMCCPVFVDAHVPQTSRNRGEHMPILRSDRRALASECVCVHTDDVILAPYLLERALSLTSVAAAYLERNPPVMYSANAFWTRPGSAPTRDDIQSFHRDQDDTRFLAMFTLLTDVFYEEDGPHDLVGPNDQVSTVYGHAGISFLADTSYLHRGRKPRSRERGLTWFRWGVSDRPPANEWDRIEPIEAARLGDRYPNDPRLRESIRLLAR